MLGKWESVCICLFSIVVPCTQVTSEMQDKDVEQMEIDAPLVTVPSSSPSVASSNAARIAWEQVNEVEELSDEFLKFNADVHQSIINAHPWTKDPHYFKSIKISAVSLLKMLIHAQSGHEKEVWACSACSLQFNPSTPINFIILGVSLVNSVNFLV